MGILGFAAILVAVLALLDNKTGFEITFSFLYLLPISIVTWYTRVEWGFLYTSISLVIWVLSNYYAGEKHHIGVWAWNFSIRLAVFLMIVLLLNELKQALENEHALASTDPLTGAWNSREFYRIAEIEIPLARRFNHPISIAYIDLDNFKEINDKKGHAEGDKLLKEVVETIAEVVRKTDIIARLGGDEFVILLPNTNAQQAKVVVQKIKDAIEQKSSRPRSPVTCSIGVATFNTPPGSVNELVSKADMLMYRGKSNGKNRIVHRRVK